MKGLQGFASAFSQIEKELESAVKDKDFDASAAVESPPGAACTAKHGEANDSDASDAPHLGLNNATDGDGSDAAARLKAALAQVRKLEERLAEKTDLCVEKDAQIAAVLKEGENLSIRQAEQEKQIRVLRQSTREAQAAAEESASQLADAQKEIERVAREHSQRASAAAGAHDVMLSEALSRADSLQAELTTERESLASARTELDRLAAEHKALSVAHATIEARETVAAEALREVQLENARLIEAGRWRDEGLQSQLGELTERRHAAEQHAEQLASAVAQATKPLLRQLASSQQQQASIQRAAAAAESALKAKLASAAAASDDAHGRLQEVRKALSAAEDEKAELRGGVERLEEELVRMQRTTSASAEAMSERHAALRLELEGSQALVEKTSAERDELERRAARLTVEARLQEGELVAVRKLLATSERKQQSLVEQLAAERIDHQRAVEELARVSGEYKTLNEHHQAALEMLGEKEEMRLMLEEELEGLRAARH